MLHFLLQLFRAKMDPRETINELTQICAEVGRSLRTITNQEEKRKLILNHIQAFADICIRINDFQTGLEWLNVDEELSITRHLSGKVVLLDFFTYCCINCMHVLPDLTDVENKFKVEDGLLVIGVHSAKFSNERDLKRLTSAVQRYGITHPVVNDASLSMWQDLGVVCWPTLIIIGPEGQPLAVFVGEGHREELFLYVDVALSYFGSLGRISRKGLNCLATTYHIPATASSPLRFPGKLQAFHTPRGEQLVISDSGNNRVIVTSLEGHAKYVIGGIRAGFRDGDFKTARFNAPQGLCILNSAIYVADTENHAIRKIDLDGRLVSTVAGTGKQGHDYIGGRIGTEQPLSSPWDVAIYEHESDGKTVPVLLIAAAGTHQIWAQFLEDTIWWKNKAYQKDVCVAIVGSGREENRNNVYPHAAGLAQPSGLTIDKDNKLAFFADSESSAVRQVDLQTGRVTALCGGNKNPADLHDYGDQDGIRYNAKLQHPLDVVWHPSEKVIYVADTYNHKIKRVDQNGLCETFCGDKKSGNQLSLDEPSGLAIASHGQFLLVADTNNHAIKVIDLKNGNTVTTLAIELSIAHWNEHESVYRFDTILSTGKAELRIFFSVKFKNGLKLNPESPQKWSADLPRGWKTEASSGELHSELHISVPPGDETNELSVTLNLIACTINECIPKKLCVLFNIQRNPSGLTVVTECAELVLS